MNETVLIILGGALATYASRAGGHLVLSRLKAVPPRLESALDAVPAAVLTAIVAPSLLTGGPIELLSLAAAGMASLRFAALPSFLAGAAILLIGRQIWMS
jgi:uncharacterized membrane protein